MNSAGESASIETKGKMAGVLLLVIAKEQEPRTC